MHQYSRSVHFYEADMMGVVHHSNYFRFLEEARFSWLKAKGLEDLHGAEQGLFFALIHTQLEFISPAKFRDVLLVELQAKFVRARLVFQYKIWLAENPSLNLKQKLLVKGETVHVSVDKLLKPVRPPKLLTQTMENEKWIETWL